MRILFISIMLSLTMALAGCDQGTNTNTANNANRTGGNSSLGNAVNTVANTVSNTVNTVTGSTDNDFMENAALGGLAEVEMGKMASTKAANPEVKKFAQMMVADHSKANDELKALAAKKGIKLPTELDSSYKATMDDLRELVGADFDREYVEAMVEDHEKDVAAFEERTRSATDADAKAFAEKTLPVLRKHLDQIKAIQAKLK